MFLLRIFEKKKFDFIAPQFLIIDVGKHTKKITEKTNLSFEEAVELLEFVIGQITFIQDYEFTDKMKEAREILQGHQKDAHYLALALKKNCKVFSGDKVFRELCLDKVRAPRELLDEFSEGD